MVGTFPLNVQAGSPKFYIPAVGNKNVGDYISVPTVAVSVPSGYSVIGNAYYTIMQDGDQDSWMTFYMPPIEDSMGTYVDVVITSAGANNNFSTTGNSTYMQCIWCKEYYDSLITQIGSGGNTVKVSQLEWDTNLVVPDGRLIETPSITVDGYTPKLIQSTGNVISYNGNPNTTIICATVPSGGVMCNGNATVEIFTTGKTNIRVYARCSSFGGKISDALLGTLVNPQTERFTVSFANAKIPESTQYIMGFYATGDYSPTITHINITSASYASKQLI